MRIIQTVTKCTMWKICRSIILTILSCALILPACSKSDESANVRFTNTIPDTIKSSTFSIAGSCNVDRINDKDMTGITSIAIDKKQALIMDGWAADVKNVNVPFSVIIELRSLKGGNTYYAAASRNAHRPDIAKAYGNRVFEGSGFDLSADIRSIPSGKYSINIIQPTNANALVCAPGKIMEIK